MPPKLRTLPWATARNRDSSPELGDPSLVPQYNKQTGRPIRRSAGQKKSVAGYVDSIIIEEDGDPIELPSEDDDGEIVKPVRSKKRKRTPSPSPPPLDAIIYHEEPDDPSEEEFAGKFPHTVSDTPVVLQFNVPLGFHGPLVVKLDRSTLMSPDEAAHDMHLQGARKRQNTKLSTSVAQSTYDPIKKTFSDLPPEIRNKIYRELFVADDELKFHTPNNFCRSAQFFYTCRLVHSEGCSVLYGENKFSFDRNRTTRAPFWDPVPKEIGYKDARRFLKMIGPENLAYLRDVKIVLEDAAPSTTPYLPTHESRRYLNDDHLIDFLRILGQTNLRRLTINFSGRRQLLKSDVKFLSYLEQIKADEVISTDNARWWPQNKIDLSVLNELKEMMTRKKKLYVKE